MGKKSKKDLMAAAKAPIPEAPTAVEQEPEPDPAIIMLEPHKILMDDNSRYGLKRIRLDRLKADIEKRGRIRTPVEVVALPEGSQNGYTHRLETGFYRTTAAVELWDDNKEILVPAIQVSEKDAKERLTRQISENTERENLSPMDEAVAIQKMLDAGLTRMEVREAFARPTGKKLAMEPASNSTINIRLSFLEFPKNIREAIHDGRLGVKGAYTLSKYPKEQWAEVFGKMEETRLKELEKEQKEEDKLLAAEKKETTKAEKSKALEEKEAKIEADIKAATAALEEQRKIYKDRQDAAKAAHDEHLNTTSKEEQKKTAERVKSTEAERNTSLQMISKAQKDLDKAMEEKKRFDEAAKKREESQAAAKKRLQELAAKKKAEKAAGESEVHKAAAAVGAKAPSTGEAKKLNLAQVRDGIKSIEVLSVPATKFPKTIMLKQALFQFMDGIISDGTLQDVCAKLVGEKESAAVSGKKK